MPILGFATTMGQYTYRRGLAATYTIEGEHLIDEFKGVKAEVFPMGNDTFFEREDIGWVTFVRDQQRWVTGYVYHFPDGQEATGKKIK